MVSLILVLNSMEVCMLCLIIFIWNLLNTNGLLAVCQIFDRYLSKYFEYIFSEIYLTSFR